MRIWNFCRISVEKNYKISQTTNLDMPDARNDNDVDVMKSDDEKNVFHWENISVDSAKINWDKIKKEGKRIKHFYVELGDVKDRSI